MMQERVPAPAPGQDTNGTNPSTALVVNSSVANVITFSPNGPSGVDARAGRALVRYTSDPGSGIWRTAGDGIREHVSPFAIVGIEPGRGAAAEIEVVLGGTADERLYEGDLDHIATNLWRAGQQRGCRAERKLVYWALVEFCDLARRQRAARGVSA